MTWPRRRRRAERIDRHYIYIDGLARPARPEGTHALTAGNGRSMWVNAQGRRFTNECGFDKADPGATC